MGIAANKRIGYVDLHKLFLNQLQYNLLKLIHLIIEKRFELIYSHKPIFDIGELSLAAFDMHDVNYYNILSSTSLHCFSFIWSIFIRYILIVYM